VQEVVSYETAYLCGVASSTGSPRSSLVTRFEDQPEAYLFGTEDGRRVKSFPSWKKVFNHVGLKVGRGPGRVGVHHTRHAAFSTASVGLSSMQMKNFTGIASESVLVKYQHADGVATALAAASELERRQLPVQLPLGRRDRAKSGSDDAVGRQVEPASLMEQIHRFIDALKSPLDSAASRV
jgi:hypothetical protein